MESRYNSMLQSLTGLSKKIQDGEVMAGESGLITLILSRLIQLDRYVISEFTFGNQSVESDIVTYAGLLQQYGRNAGDKIDFIIDLGNAEGGWNGDIAMHLQEILDDIEDYSNLF